MPITHKSQAEFAFEMERLECPNGNGALCDAMNCKCGRDIFRKLLSGILEGFDPKRTLFVTIYFPRDSCKQGQLSTFSIRNSKRKLARVLKDSGVAIDQGLAVGDTQLRTFSEQWHNKVPCYEFHWHLILQTREPPNEVSRKLREAMPTSKKNFRHVLVKRITYWPFKTSYLLKYAEEIPRRVQFVDQPLREGHKLRLQANHRKEVEQFMAENNVQNWILIRRKRES